MAIVSEVARHLDLTPRRVQQLAGMGIIPKPLCRGRYDLDLCIVSYVRYLLHRIEQSGANGLRIEKTRLTRAQAEKAEIETARLKAELVPLADAERGWQALVEAFRARTLQVPREVVAALAVLPVKTEEEIERAVTCVVYAALTEVAAWMPEDDSDD